MTNELRFYIYHYHKWTLPITLLLTLLYEFREPYGVPCIMYKSLNIIEHNKPKNKFKRGISS